MNGLHSFLHSHRRENLKSYIHSFHYNFSTWYDKRKKTFIYVFTEVNNTIRTEIAGAAMLVLLMGEIYEVRLWDDLRWYDIRSLLMISSGIQVIFKVISWKKNWQAAVLILRVRGIWEVRRQNCLSRHNMHTKFHDYRCRRTHARTHRARWSHNPTHILQKSGKYAIMAQEVYNHLPEIVIRSRFLTAICNCTSQTVLPSPTMNPELSLD
jgi:hypothetical protein